MRIIGQQEHTFPNGDRGIWIAAGPGMLRRIRRLVAAHRCVVEAISKRGKVIASGIPGRPWHPKDSIGMTWGGLGRRLPKRASYDRKNSGARRSSSWR